MKYVKATERLPEELLKEIQKYVYGELLYIPNPQGKRKKWGMRSGSREMLESRNRDMRQAFRQGASIEELADRHALSYDTTKKIVYSKKT